MKELLKRCGINKWSLSALLIAFATIPLPGLKGNPTGLMLSHDHASRYVKKNSIDLSNHKMASLNMDYSALMESRKSAMLQGYQMRLMFLEDKAERINESTRYSDQEKTRKMIETERQLDRLYDKIDKEGFRLEELRSANDKMMFAMSQ